MASSPLSCWCGAAIVILPSYGGNSKGATLYAAHCRGKCGIVQDDLASNCSGKKRDAVAEWNRIRKKPQEAPRKGPLVINIIPRH